MYIAPQKRRAISEQCRLVAETCPFYEAVAVGTFRNSGIVLVSTHGNAVEGTEILGNKIVAAL